jgi:hypothetical protein
MVKSQMSLVIEEEEGIELSCLSRGIVQEKTSHLYPGACGARF